MIRTRRLFVIPAVFGLALATPALAQMTTTITFDAGAEGMVGPSGAGGATTIDATGGNPGANMHTVFNDFGITFRNSTNAAFIGDLAANSEVTISIDLQVDSLTDFIGNPSIRPWLVELRDYDDPEPGFPWTSVWFKWTDVTSAAQGTWTPFSVTIDDPSSVALPAGWGGYGDEDPDTFEPILPADRTFTDVLASIDEIAFTTLEPGFFFNSNDFDFRIDNVSITVDGPTVPTASEWGLIAMLVLLMTCGAVVIRRARPAGAASA